MDKSTKVTKLQLDPVRALQEEIFKRRYKLTEDSSANPSPDDGKQHSAETHFLSKQQSIIPRETRQNSNASSSEVQGTLPRQGRSSSSLASLSQLLNSKLLENSPLINPLLSPQNSFQIKMTPIITNSDGNINNIDSHHSLNSSLNDENNVLNLQKISEEPERQRKLTTIAKVVKDMDKKLRLKKQDKGDIFYQRYIKEFVNYETFFNVKDIFAQINQDDPLTLEVSDRDLSPSMNNPDGENSENLFRELKGNHLQDYKDWISILQKNSDKYQEQIRQQQQQQYLQSLSPLQRGIIDEIQELPSGNQTGTNKDRTQQFFKKGTMIIDEFAQKSKCSSPIHQRISGEKSETSAQKQKNYLEGEDKIQNLSPFSYAKSVSPTSNKSNYSPNNFNLRFKKFQEIDEEKDNIKKMQKQQIINQQQQDKEVTKMEELVSGLINSNGVKERMYGGEYDLFHINLNKMLEKSLSKANSNSTLNGMNNNSQHNNQNEALKDKVNKEITKIDMLIHKAASENKDKHQSIDYEEKSKIFKARSEQIIKLIRKGGYSILKDKMNSLDSLVKQDITTQRTQQIQRRGTLQQIEQLQFFPLNQQQNKQNSSLDNKTKFTLDQLPNIVNKGQTYQNIKNKLNQINSKQKSSQLDKPKQNYYFYITEPLKQEDHNKISFPQVDVRKNSSSTDNTSQQIRKQKQSLEADNQGTFQANKNKRVSLFTGHSQLHNHDYFSPTDQTQSSEKQQQGLQKELLTENENENKTNGSIINSIFGKKMQTKVQQNKGHHSMSFSYNLHNKSNSFVDKIYKEQKEKIQQFVDTVQNMNDTQNSPIIPNNPNRNSVHNVNKNKSMSVIQADSQIRSNISNYTSHKIPINSSTQIINKQVNLNNKRINKNNQIKLNSKSLHAQMPSIKSPLFMLKKTTEKANVAAQKYSEKVQNVLYNIDFEQIESKQVNKQFNCSINNHHTQLDTIYKNHNNQQQLESLKGIQEEVAKDILTEFQEKLEGNNYISKLLL